MDFVSIIRKHCEKWIQSKQYLTEQVSGGGRVVIEKIL